MKEKCKLFGRIMIFVFCIGVMLFGAMFVMHKDQDKEELLKIANPVTEVKSLNEMKKYLGYEVPLIGEKEVSKYIVIGKGKVANHGRIIYKDKSEFDMEKGKFPSEKQCKKIMQVLMIKKVKIIIIRMKAIKMRTIKLKMKIKIKMRTIKMKMKIKIKIKI